MHTQPRAWRRSLTGACLFVVASCGSGEVGQSEASTSTVGASTGGSSSSDPADSTGVPTTGHGDSASMAATDATTSNATTSSTTSDTTNSTTSSDATTSTTLTDTDDTTTGDPPVCGDGLVAGGEACDDGNDADADGCEHDCTWTPCTVLWQINAAEGSQSIGHGVLADSAGNVVVGGEAQFGQPMLEARVWKYTPEGAPIWEAAPLGPIQSTAFALGLMPADGLVVVGDRTDEAFVHPFQARLDGDGAVVWATENFAMNLAVRSVAVAPEGGVVIAANNILTNTPLLAALTPDGAVDWMISEVPAGATSAGVLGVAIDPAGDIFLTGSATFSTGRLWLERRTSAGAKVWTRAFAEPGKSTHGLAIAIGSDGTLAIAGTLGLDGRVTTFEPVAGDLLWTHTLDSGLDEGLDWGRGVAIDAAGQVLMSGDVSLSPELDKNYYKGAFRRYTADGELLCELILDVVPGTNTFLRGLTIDADGFPIVTGAVQSQLYVAKLTP